MHFWDERRKFVSASVMGNPVGIGRMNKWKEDGVVEGLEVGG